MSSKMASIACDMTTRLLKNPTQLLIVKGTSQPQKCRRPKKKPAQIDPRMSSFCLDLKCLEEMDLIRKVLENPRIENQGSLIGQSTRKFSSTPNTAPHIEGYKIVEHLGTGGSATVWKALHVALRRFVAIKIMDETIEERATLRLAREYRILTSIHHPNLLNAFTMGLVESRLWMGMEYCLRGSLRDHLHRPWACRPSAKLISQLAKATQVIHNQGILHRDIKPGNIMLNRWFKPKLADFDLALTLEAGGSHTRQAYVNGTPSYMAPEQVRGTKIDHRIDIHGLGAVLFHLLTGCPPFQGEFLEEVLMQVVHHEPCPQRSRDPRIPQGLSEICSKCLQKDPSKRYQTSKELADDLDAFLHRC